MGLTGHKPTIISGESRVANHPITRIAPSEMRRKHLHWLAPTNEEEFLWELNGL
jgi:hypothetical protein